MNRDKAGNILPVVANDPHKMIDVNVYLEAMSKAEAKDKEIKSKGKK